MGDIEWLAGLYCATPLGVQMVNDAIIVENPETIVLPADAFSAAICSAAAATKQKKIFTAAVIVDADARLIYPGEQSVLNMIRNSSFRDTRLVRIGQARVMRTRPFFKEWHAEFNLIYSEPVESDHIIRAVKHAGLMVGVGDFRPRFGRFEITAINGVAQSENGASAKKK